MKILLPDTMPLHPELPEGWESVVVGAREPIPAEHHDARALVVWGSSRRHLDSAAHDLSDLGLVQSLAAGVEGILAAGFRDDVVIASGTGLHSAMVSEHALAITLALVRRLPESIAAQARHEWSTDIGGLQPLHHEDRVTTLLDAKVLIWGFGDIGQTLAPMLAALGAHVTGVARSAGTRAGFPVIAEQDVAAELPDTDVLIDILPASDSTRHVIDTEVLAALHHRALFVNVGRGATVDQPALLAALRAGELGGAALDVTDPEPPAADDPVWDTPRLLLTPHAAGGRPVGADERISHNVRALAGAKDTEFLHRVNRSA